MYPSIHPSLRKRTPSPIRYPDDEDFEAFTVLLLSLIAGGQKILLRADKVIRKVRTRDGQNLVSRRYIICNQLLMVVILQIY